MQWPTRSPEHIRDQMEQFIRDMDNLPTTVTRLREALFQAWGEVTPETIEVLVRSMRRWLRGVMSAREGNSWY